MPSNSKKGKRIIPIKMRAALKQTASAICIVFLAYSSMTSEFFFSQLTTANRIIAIHTGAVEFNL